jgi:hypothetical protein
MVMIVIVFFLDHGSNPSLVMIWLALKFSNKSKVFFLRLFQDKNLEGTFILNPIAKIIRFFIFNKGDEEQKTTKKKS